MSDWYDKGYARVIDDIEAIIATLASSHDAAKSVYVYLSEAGFIDYDVEKEIFAEWFYDEE